MNILLISPYFRPMMGGVETHLEDLCKYLASKKHTVYVKTYKAFGVKNRGEIYEEKNYLKISRLDYPDYGLIFKLEQHPSLKFIYFFTGLFIDCFFFMIKNSKKIDVIQAHGFIAAMIGVILGKVFKKRIVVNTHVSFNFSKGFITKVIKTMLLLSDQILVLTSGIKQSLINLGIPTHKIAVYHYWVDQKLFHPIKSAKKKLNWDNKFTVLFVGRLIEIKGIMIVFKLAKKLKKINFIIAGSGPLSERVNQMYKKYKNITFLGKMDNNKLPLIYNASDILLIPSKIIRQEYEEGIPRVMIEALSCGLPVISTKSGGILDIFSREVGAIVEDKLVLIEKAIKEYYQNQAFLKDISKDCRAFALKNFSAKNAHIIENSLLGRI